MSGGFQPSLDFAAAASAAEDGEALIVDIDGYEGPLHVLLALARSQKVDLLQLSILKLAEQYLAFVHQARRAQFSLAADYLVMASWLAYLKSRLLLPKTDRKSNCDEPAPEELAALAGWACGQFVKLSYMYRADFYAESTVAALLKKVTHTGSPHPHKHLHKIRTAQ